jgi:outer membrane autotransporter protein
VKTDGQSWDRVLVNVGIGGELALTNDLSLGLEVKYQYIKDLSRIPINLSLTYRF